jgi:hypothetical protein
MSNPANHEQMPQPIADAPGYIPNSLSVRRGTRFADKTNGRNLSSHRLGESQHMSKGGNESVEGDQISGCRDTARFLQQCVCSVTDDGEKIEHAHDDDSAVLVLADNPDGNKSEDEEEIEEIQEVKETDDRVNFW